MKKHYDFSKGKRGPVFPLPQGKTRITIRIDDDVLDWFRQQADDAGGGSYQKMMNAVLREYMSTKAEPLDQLLRRVIREELLSRSRKVAAGGHRRS